MAVARCLTTLLAVHTAATMAVIIESWCTASSTITSNPLAGAESTTTSSLLPVITKSSAAAPYSFPNGTTSSVGPGSTGTSGGPTCVCLGLNPIASFTPDNDTTPQEFWTGPDWADMPTSYTPWNLPFSVPAPNPITDPAVIRLVQTVQDELLLQYNNMGIMSCFIKGNTANCDGPWLDGDSWSNGTMAEQIVPNTELKPDWQCSSDQTYLSSESRVFYGFNVDNVTDSLESIAHSVSLFAGLTCVSNSSCTAAYQNDTAQMYMDFRNFVNATFFTYMADKLGRQWIHVLLPKGHRLVRIHTNYPDYSLQWREGVLRPTRRHLHPRRGGHHELHIGRG